MLSFLTRRPRNLDAAFRDLAEMLTKDTRRPTYRVGLLAPAQLDYSVESVKHVEAYLRQLRGNAIGEEERTILLLRCGAYIGETIRRAAGDNHWIDYASAARMSSGVAALGNSLWTSAVLWQAPAGFCFPIAKVGKFLGDGDEDSLAFFVQTILARRTSF